MIGEKAADLRLFWDPCMPPDAPPAWAPRDRPPEEFSEFCLESRDENMTRSTSELTVFCLLNADRELRLLEPRMKIYLILMFHSMNEAVCDSENN